MSSRTSKVSSAANGSRQKKASTARKPTTAVEDYAPEADFDDTIAKNRALPVIDAETIPVRHADFRPTHPDVRRRRLRRMAGDLRAEAVLALNEASNKGAKLKADLGEHAPPPERAVALVDRLTRTGELVVAVESLRAYATELDEIALNDAVIYLEKEDKEFLHQVEHKPLIATRYPALRKFIDSRSAAIAEGIARSKAAAPGDGEGEDAGGGEAGDGAQEAEAKGNGAAAGAGKK